MSFADPELHRRRSRRGARDSATVEFGHRESRTGIIVELDGVRSGELRAVLESMFERAGSTPSRACRIVDPGWWSAVLCAAALDRGVVALVQRVPARAVTHAVVVVERGSMVELDPAWPLVRIGHSGAWVDMRGESALARGPSGADLDEYAAVSAVGVPRVELRRMFDMGVLEWRRVDHRWRVRAAR